MGAISPKREKDCIYVSTLRKNEVHEKALYVVVTSADVQSRLPTPPENKSELGQSQKQLTAAFERTLHGNYFGNQQ